MRSFFRGLIALAGAVALLVPASGAWAQRAPAGAALVQQAAQAMGGADRIQRIRNITLYGYGHYAYQLGGANISAEPEAPQKYQQANDLRRVYDLQNNRYQELDRRNFLFPFLIGFGHAFNLGNQVLDGDIAYNLPPQGAPQRVARMAPGMNPDGVHMRRMLMMNNPAVAVRRALDLATRLSAPRREDGLQVIDVVLAEGDRFSLGFDPQTRLPEMVRWINPMANLGQVTFTTRYSGFAPWNGVMLPMAYKTNMDWRNIEFSKIWVDNYVFDSQIADLAAPPAVRTAGDGPAPVPAIEAFQVGPGVWRLSGGTNAIAFKDHIKLYELGNPVTAKAVIERARQLAPGKPVTHLIISHPHFDHVQGLRTAVAEGLTIVGHRGAEPIVREMASRRAPDYPDDLERAFKPLKWVPIDERMRFSDETMTMDLYWARNNIHMANAVFAHIPAQKVLIEGDIATAALEYQFWPDNLWDNIEHYGLQVETVSPVHTISRDYPNTMTLTQLETLVKGGVERARQRCAAEQATNHWFAGCPVNSKRFN